MKNFNYDDPIRGEIEVANEIIDLLNDYYLPVGIAQNIVNRVQVAIDKTIPVQKMKIGKLN